MGTSLNKTLNEIVEFGLLSSSNTVKIELLQRYCQQVDELLEHIRPVCNEIAVSEISDGKLVNMLEEIEVLLNAVRDRVESWHPMMSKLYFALQIEDLIRKLYSLTLDVCELVRILLPAMEDDFPTKCIERIQDVHHEQISILIHEAMRDQIETNIPRPEHLDKISTFLSLLSNEELLTEAVAVEKLKVTLGRGENNVEMQNIDRMNALVTYMHDLFVKTNQLHNIKGVPIPPDFCCPLSLQLMSDPVIVASGQTYERTFIRKWLDQGFTVCPKTRQKLSHTNLIPNYTVKALIANWCESNNIKLPDPVKSAGSNLTPAFLSSIDASGSNDNVISHSGHSPRSNFLRSPERIIHLATSQHDSYSSNGVHRESHMMEKPASSFQYPVAGTSPSRIVNGVDGSIVKSSLATDGIKEPNVGEMHESSYSQAANQLKHDSQSSRVDDQLLGQNHTISSVNSIPTNDGIQEATETDMVSRVSSDLTPYSSDVSGEVAQDAPASSATPREPDLLARSGEPRTRVQNIWRRPSVPRIISSQAAESGQDLSGIENQVRKLVENLKSESSDVQRDATAELRLLARNNMENRIIITKCGAINLLVGLLHSEDSAIQENAVTALLNLSINDNNKTAIAQADAIDPLIHVLQTGSPEAKENAAATLFSLSVIEENKVKIGRSGAIKPLVDLLGNGTPRGKKDAATALFNLSIFHENKARIVKDGAVRHLVELMDPAAGMVDKAVAVLSNLATIPEGRTAIGHAGGIPVLVEVVELGSARGKENAAAALLQLCTTSSRFCSQVIQEGAVPPLVALLQSGTPRAKEKAQTLLSYFRNQRHGNAGRG